MKEKSQLALSRINSILLRVSYFNAALSSLVFSIIAIRLKITAKTDYIEFSCFTKNKIKTLGYFIMIKYNIAHHITEQYCNITIPRYVSLDTYL